MKVALQIIDQLHGFTMAVIQAKKGLCQEKLILTFSLSSAHLANATFNSSSVGFPISVSHIRFNIIKRIAQEREM